MNYLANLDSIFGAIMVVQYFNDSNFAGQVIVCLLIVFSLVAWTIMLGKWTDLKELKGLNMNIERKLAKSSGVFECMAECKGYKGPYASLLNEAVAAWGRVSSGDFSQEMLAVRMGHVENALQRSVARQSMKYESKMVLLGSIISGAPFLGLLGTVWGVMDSFGAMGKDGAATTLQSLAPGVSGALLTTVAGLLVAIPSVFGYNFLLTLARGMVLDLENFASSLADRIELESRERFSQKPQYKGVSKAGSQGDLFASQTGESRIRDFSQNVPPAPKPLQFNVQDDVDGDMPPRDYDE